MISVIIMICVISMIRFIIMICVISMISMMSNLYTFGNSLNKL